MTSWPLFIVAASLFMVTNCVADEHGSHVTRLNASTFSKEVAKKNTFVMFFAPWCGHCKRLAPTWDELAEKYNNEEHSVTIAKVDCTAETELCSEEGITGYPTLKLFKTGKDAVRYKGPRDLESLEVFAKEHSGLPQTEDIPITKPQKGLIELADTSFHKHVEVGMHFIKFYAPWCGHCQTLAPVWEELAQTFEHDPSLSIAKVDCVAHRSICTEFEVKGYPSLLWIHDGKMIEKYQGGRSHEELKTYADLMKRKAAKTEDEGDTKPADDPPSLVVTLTGANFDNSIARGVTFIKFFAPWCGHCRRLAPTWEELALKLVGNPSVSIAEVDCTTDSGKDVCAREGVEGYPTMILYKEGKKIEEFNGSRDLESLYSYVLNHVPHDEL